MHREIQIKQFPIVTTHWWPKTWNERFVWENEQYLYSFLPLVHKPCPSDLSAHHTSGVWRVCASTLDRGRVWDRLMQIPNPVHATQEKYVIGCCTMTARQHHASDTPSSSVWRRRPGVECSVSQSARNTRHTPDVCALRSLGHGCVQEVKNDINTVRFLTQTARFVS